MMDFILNQINLIGWSVFAYFVGMFLLVIIMTWCFFFYRRYLELERKLPDAVKLKDLQSRIHGLEEHKNDLKQEIEEQCLLINANAQLVENVEKSKKWLEENNLTVESLKERIQEERKSYEEALKVKDVITKDINNLQENKQALLKELDLFTARKCEYEKLDEKIQGFKDEIKILSLQLAELTQKISESKTDHHRYLGILEDIKTQIERKEKELNSIAQQTLIKALEVRKLEQEIKALDAEKALLETQAKHQSKIVDNLTKAVETFSNNVVKLTPAALDVRLEDLYRPVFNKECRMDNKVKTEEFVLKGFETELQKYNLNFSPRTIRTLHTGLKIADYSTLVVLSGISGTGKSLLPKLYASYFGIQFLSIAVQPRWDGSQDLFGFYNYMENRFKATELSRLLWQLDQYNNPSSHYSGDRIPMALILLDEMNLARVEYYFSDVLSKLEARRDINDPSDPKQRKIPEIELEAGPLQEDETGPRLFIGKNILFVGTMNEDETTQTLSDKVIDRSNLIRFGMPAKLVQTPRTDEFIGSNVDSPLLTLGSWEKWKKNELPTKFKKKMEDLMSELNLALNQIGRPFGHRLSNAITQYIINYPTVSDGVESAFNDALSDQIEMKILPKLNGLELGGSDAIKKIINLLVRIIDDTKDGELRKAFEQVTSDEHPFFQWKGVSRKA